MNGIRTDGALPLPPALGIEGTSAPKKAGEFGAVLKDAVAEVNRLQAEADKQVEGLVTGKDATVHGTLVSLEKADLSFKLMMKVRDKIVDAYREVMRMNV